MTTARKVTIALIAVVAVACGPVLVIVLCNAGSGVAEYISSTTPLARELSGRYSYTAAWGASTLTIANDQSFTQLIQNKAESPRMFRGKWSSALAQAIPEVMFSDLLSVQDNDHGRQQGSSGMHVTKSRFSGRIALQINDDLGQQFDKTE